MKSLTYLTILFATIVVCFLFSFHPKLKFNRHFSAFLKGSFLVAIPFIAWDVWFTKLGVWWFDYSYTIGISWFELPVEEWLFFLCIPFSCVFTYFCFTKFFRFQFLLNRSSWVSYFFLILMAVSICCFYDRMYTLLTSIVLLGTFVFLQFIVKANWLAKAVFIYVLLLFGFIPVNGILTGTGIDSPIVNYNPDEFLGIRLLTIPIEDWFYGLAQFLLNIYFFLYFAKSRVELS